MMILVDTNVISDVIHTDPHWEDWALERFADYFGNLAINPIVYSELCCRAKSIAELELTLEPFEFSYLELPKEALFKASQAFVKYRKRGGTKTSTLPDFFIGAHASATGMPILTRDVARYRAYFPEVKLISPE